MQDHKKFLAIAADRLSHLGRHTSDYALLRRLDMPELSLERVRRLQKHAEQDLDADLALKALEVMCRKLEHSNRPADQRALANLRGSDLAALGLASATYKPDQPVVPVQGRVLYVLHQSRPYLSNGYATRSHGMATGMLAAGIDLVCLTRPGFPLDVKKELTEAPLKDCVGGVTYLRDLTPRRSGPDRSRTYLSDAADVIEARIREHRPQAVIVASNYVAAVPALIAARRAGVPIAYEVRGFWEITQASHNPDLADTFDHLVKMRVEGAAAAAADHVFTLSTPMRDELVRRGVPAGRITLLPNSCDPTQFTPHPRDMGLAARIGLPADVPVIGYIGSFVQYEGLDDLARACALLRDQGHVFRLILVGASEGPVHESLVKIAQETGLGDWLIMPGRVPHEEVEAWYSLIDIAPFPRKPQPVTEMVPPLKPLEAMAMEKAVVVSSVGAMAEMVEDGVTGLVFKKGDTNALSDALSRLIADAEVRISLGKNARAYVESERTWFSMGGRVKDWLREQHV